VIIIVNYNNMIWNLLLIATMASVSIVRGYLSVEQISLVQSIIRCPRTPPIILDKTKRILYQHYYPWVIKETREFTRIHKKAIRNIVKPHSMQLYAMHGFSKAIENYNGTSAFHLYAKLYIEGELYRGLTESAVLKPYTHSWVITNKNKTGIHSVKYRKSLVSYEEYWTFDKLVQNKKCGKNNFTDSTWVESIRDSVNGLSMEERRIFYLRYNYYDLSINKSVYKICELLCISQETYRKRMNAILDKIRRNTNGYQ
jgi:DNA-directed RNA polymerase specialized sigma subunit